MDSLLAAGAKAAPVTKGVPFDIVLTDAGSKIATTDFDLKPASGASPFHLSFPGLSYSGGHVKGNADLKNTAGTPLQGVRLDIVGATETYKAKDPQGNDVQRTREIEAVLPSPLSFGDIADGDSNGQLPFDVAGIDFKPETVSISVHGIVSGERYLRTMDFPTVGSDAQIDLDSAGHVYLSSTVDNCVTRGDNDGKNIVALCKLPDQTKGMAVDRKTGTIAATCGNHSTIYFFDANGNEKSHLEDGVLDSYPDFQRYDTNGRLWSNVGSAYWSFDTSNKPNQKVSKFGDFDSTGGRFDVAPDGTIYAATEDAVLVRHPDGKGGVFAKGNGDKLGQLYGPKSVRVSPDGLIYVAQDMDNVPLSGITVYDTSGRVVREFGRGAKRRPDKFPDEYWPSQLYRPADIAFGPDGNVYVSSQGKQATSTVVFVYAPF
jgi:hypothetical protein